MKGGDITGLALLQKKYGLIGVKYENGEKRLVMISSDHNKPPRTESISLNQNSIYLNASCDFVDLKDEANFFYSLDGQKRN